MRAFCIFSIANQDDEFLRFIFCLAILKLLCGPIAALAARGFLAFTRPAPRFCSYFAFVLIFCAYA